ncbi:MAG: response regulator transcription factor [Planctomycetota bacterium]|jgi:DNA-binding CsgD family transcriptional regulator
MKLTKKQLEQIKTQYRLSPRETQVVDLILQGVDSNAELAKSLGLTIATIKQYVHVLFAKFHINSKTNLVIKIFESIQ